MNPKENQFICSSVRIRSETDFLWDTGGFVWSKPWWLGADYHPLPLPWTQPNKVCDVSFINNKRGFGGQLLRCQRSHITKVFITRWVEDFLFLFFVYLEFVWSRTPPLTTHKLTERLLPGGFWLFRMSGWWWRGLNRWFRMQSVVVVGECDTCERENSHASQCPAEITCRKERKQPTFSDSSLCTREHNSWINVFFFPFRWPDSTQDCAPGALDKAKMSGWNREMPARSNILADPRGWAEVWWRLFLRRCAKSNLWQRLTGVNKGWWCCWWWWGTAGDCEDEYNSGIVKHVIWTSLQYIEHARNCAAVH